MATGEELRYPLDRHWSMGLFQGVSERRSRDQAWLRYQIRTPLLSPVRCREWASSLFDRTRREGIDATGEVHLLSHRLANSGHMRQVRCILSENALIVST